MIKKIGLSLVFALFVVFTIQAQIPGTPFFWQKKKTIAPCPPSNKSAVIDTDGDGIFDACDLDSDNDGILDGLEDSNGDGIFSTDDLEGDLVFGIILGNGVANYLDLDSDNDGILDLWESGIPISILNSIDANHDGIIDTGVAVGANGFADVLETFPDSGVAKYALADTDCDGVPDYLDTASNNLQFDLYAIGKSNLDQLGGGFITPIADVDHDGIMNNVDIDWTERGSANSPVSPYANNTNLSLTDTNGNGISDGCNVPDLAPSFILGNQGVLYSDFNPHNFVLTVNNTTSKVTNGSIVVELEYDPALTIFGSYQTGLTTIQVEDESATLQNVSVANADWTIANTGTKLILTSKPGVVINALSSSNIGLTFSRDLTITSGIDTFKANVTVGSGSETNGLNNAAIFPITYYDFSSK
ncbi:MAG: hypothetical protein EOO98_00050 [Pedobacter sp.]|nr:MAG: hypothetical protein EOO98_00050 [Pedobacter sp.]